MFLFWGLFFKTPGVSKHFLMMAVPIKSGSLRAAPRRTDWTFLSWCFFQGTIFLRDKFSLPISASTQFSSSFFKLSLSLNPAFCTAPPQLQPPQAIWAGGLSSLRTMNFVMCSLTKTWTMWCENVSFFCMQAGHLRQGSLSLLQCALGPYFLWNRICTQLRSRSFSKYFYRSSKKKPSTLTEVVCFPSLFRSWIFLWIFHPREDVSA